MCLALSKKTILNKDIFCFYSTKGLITLGLSDTDLSHQHVVLAVILHSGFVMLSTKLIKSMVKKK